MRKEKSCGALVYKRENNKTMILLLKHRYGEHWSFPKGHVESGESEVQTALREIREETGLKVCIQENFRECVYYSPKPDTKKMVVYFLAYPLTNIIKKQDEEIGEIMWADMDEAVKIVTFKNDRELLGKAKEYLKKHSPINQSV